MPLDNETPEGIFERGWAVLLLDRAVSRLRAEFIQHGSPDDFEKLKLFLLGQAEVPYAELARQMGATEGGLKVAIHRLRYTLPGPLHAGNRGDRSGPFRSGFGNPIPVLGAQNRKMKAAVRAGSDFAKYCPSPNSL